MQIQTKQLLNELKWAQRFTESKSTIPILQSVLFDVKGKTLTLTATDLETSGVTTLEGIGKAKWSVAAPIKGLIKYLQKVDEPEVALGVTDTNQLTVAHGPGVSRTDGMSKDSFPELPKFPPATAWFSNLDEAIHRTSFAISPEESRFTLNGALLEIEENEARMVATDGHRLALSPVEVKSATKLNVLLPKPALIELGKLEGDCAFSVTMELIDPNDPKKGERPQFCFFDFGQHKIVTRAMTGNFPEYRRVLGTGEWPNHIFLPVKATLKTLERVAVYADERSRAVTFEIEAGKLTIKSHTSDTGTAEGVVTPLGGEITAPLVSGYNWQYISEFLSKVEDQNVAFCWTNEKNGASFLADGRWIYLLMPLRI